MSSTTELPKGYYRTSRGVRSWSGVRMSALLVALSLIILVVPFDDAQTAGNTALAHAMLVALLLPLVPVAGYSTLIWPSVSGKLNVESCRFGAVAFRLATAVCAAGALIALGFYVRSFADAFGGHRMSDLFGVVAGASLPLLLALFEARFFGRLQHVLSGEPE